MENKQCMRYLVAGKVQGVWYRDSTQKEAMKLGITGWVRNLADGRVEVLACGEKDKLSQLQKWLRKGPPLAKVEDVFAEPCDWQEFDRFFVK